MDTTNKNSPASCLNGATTHLPAEVHLTHHVLEAAARQAGQQCALSFGDWQVSYSELEQLANRAACGLQQLGAGPGSHIGLLLSNSPHYMIAFFGILKIGGTVVNYSPLDAERVICHKANDSKTDILITLDDPQLYARGRTALDNSGVRHLVVGAVSDRHGQLADEQNPRPSPELSWHALLHNDGQYRQPAWPEGADSPAVIQYTGGTTGTPKGAVLTHRNLVSACTQLLSVLVHSEPAVLQYQRERVLVTLPLFHIYALTASMLLPIALRAHMRLLQRFDPAEVLDAIEQEQVSVFSGVPTMFTALAGHPDIAQRSLRSLRYCGSGGAPLPLEVAQRFQELTGCAISEGWGMTETSPTGTFTPVYGPRRAGSCGRPLPGIDIRFLDEKGFVPFGEIGELCIRGPNVMKGYWNNPEATREAFLPDGYFRTGDVGYMDEDGFVFIIDRSKDMLLCGGYNVYPRIIEEAIQEHPDVREVCVIGITDAYRGQTPKAFISLKTGAKPLTLSELQTFLKTRVGKHENIGALSILDDLPKTPVGKLSKITLQQQEQKSSEPG
ncbi:long-chain-fatty-acid--CoA ligase [Halopseudomonas maritima]|uniref:long-chain-fatty-acid--CoA ligase n=1 Tax=Halopseudomonas maritima TaxID=2918528 RepID=UPI001EEB78BA|nr:long-chain fatty acid--CoA ligase [Halopseudomonas maritima]UJJ33077.1 long-chain fatty acid--CoA ligase [Halopseudomonas maritima]